LSPRPCNDIIKEARVCRRSRVPGFPHFLEFFFPEIHRDIVLSGVVFIGNDFQKITKESEVGSRYADKIVRVKLKEGGEKVLLIHVEVQGEPDGEFERRLYVYTYRIYDRFSRDVVTLVVLTGDSPARAPFRYEFGRWGFRHFLSSRR
jgi:hypothetical protein